MTRAGARMRLREMLAPIAPRVDRGFDVPDIRDALLLLQVVEGRSFELGLRPDLDVPEGQPIAAALGAMIAYDGVTRIEPVGSMSIVLPSGVG